MNKDASGLSRYPLSIPTTMKQEVEQEAALMGNNMVDVIRICIRVGLLCIRASRSKNLSDGPFIRENGVETKIVIL